MKFIGTLIDRCSIQGNEKVKFIVLQHNDPVEFIGEYDWPYFCRTKRKDVADLILKNKGFRINTYIGT